MRLAVGHTQVALVVPQQLARDLQAAVQAGSDEAAGWARIHPLGSTDRFRRDSLASIMPPPMGAAQAAELAEVHAAERSRTPAGNARAIDLARRAGWDTWEATIAYIGESQGPQQARRAARLMEESARRTDEVSREAKQHYGRLRPFQIDPTLSPLVAKPSLNASYPSGHASGAYAAALVLAALAPERAADLLDVAAQVAYSRIYGGVHFPSDVVVGARIASRVASDVLRRANVRETLAA